MAIDDSMLLMVGFVVLGDEPVGTCFLVRVASELHPDRPDLDHGYVVTASHCVPPDGKDRRIWMATRDKQLYKDIRPDQWFYHDSADIAAAPWFAADDDRFWMALPLYEHACDRVGIGRVRLGAIIYYAGLLRPVRSLATRGEPMLRTASLARSAVCPEHRVLGRPDRHPG